MHKSEASNRSPPGANELTEAIDRCRPGGTHWTSQLPARLGGRQTGGERFPATLRHDAACAQLKSVAHTEHDVRWMTPPGRTMRSATTGMEGKGRRQISGNSNQQENDTIKTHPRCPSWPTCFSTPQAARDVRPRWHGRAAVRGNSQTSGNSPHDEPSPTKAHTRVGPMPNRASSSRSRQSGGLS